MFTKCSLYTHYKFTKCSLYIHNMFTICVNKDQLMLEQLELLSFSIVSLNFHYMFTKCSLYTHYMFTIYSLYIHNMFTICVNKDKLMLEQLELLSFLIVSVNIPTVSVLQSIEVQHKISCNLQS